jgi:hypothetical protein
MRSATKIALATQPSSIHSQSTAMMASDSFLMSRKLARKLRTIMVPAIFSITNQFTRLLTRFNGCFMLYRIQRVA